MSSLITLICSIFLLVNSPNENDKWKLIHFESSLQSTESDKSVEETQANFDNKPVKPAVNHNLDDIHLRLKKIFFPTYKLTFVDEICKIGNVGFKSTKSLFNFLFKGSIFSVSQREALKLKKIIYFLPSPKRKLITKNTLKYLDKISDGISNKQ